MRPLYESMIQLHRATEQHQSTSAAIHLAYAEKLARRLNLEMDDPAPPPLFMGAVADTLRARSAIVNLTVDTAPGLDVTAAATALGRAAQDLEQVLGEGPAHDVITAGQISVSSPDVLAERWPRYGPGIVALGITSIAAVDLRVSSATLGSLIVLDPREPEAPASLHRMRVVGEALADMLLANSGEAFRPLLDQADFHDVTHRAIGMVMTQANCVAADALSLLEARAFSDNVALDVVAARVVAGALVLDR